MKNTITINASFCDAINRIIYYKDAKPRETKEIYLYNETDKSEVINTLQNCISYEITEDSILCVIHTSKEEKQEALNHYKRLSNSNIASLKKWCSLKEEYKKQITEYLEYKKLNWILNKLNK